MSDICLTSVRQAGRVSDCMPEWSDGQILVYIYHAHNLQHWAGSGSAHRVLCGSSNRHRWIWSKSDLSDSLTWYFFVRPDIEKNSLLHFSNTASDEIPRVSDSVYSAVLNISIFVNAPQKMSDLECQTLFRSITPPKPSPENFWTWFSFVSDKIESDRYQFFGNRASSCRDTCLQTRPTKNSVLSSEKPLATLRHDL